ARAVFSALPAIGPGGGRLGKGAGGHNPKHASGPGDSIYNPLNTLKGVGLQPSEGLDYRGWWRDTTVASR
ncbi:MAG: hypothetical protein V3T17_13955, partial [Pseudomonadales bacterium]